MTNTRCERLGILGGSFDPPHNGHVAICRQLLQEGRVDRIIVVPCLIHPFGKELHPFEERLALARAAFADFGVRVEVSPIEQELGGVSRTVRTMLRLQETHRGAALHLIIGADAFARRGEWLDFDEIARRAPPIVVSRGAGSPIPDISSTQIRARLEAGEGIDDLVPPAVAAYITAHRLYR